MPLPEAFKIQAIRAYFSPPLTPFRHYQNALASIHTANSIDITLSWWGFHIFMPENSRFWVRRAIESDVITAFSDAGTLVPSPFTLSPLGRAHIHCIRRSFDVTRVFWDIAFDCLLIFLPYSSYKKMGSNTRRLCHGLRISPRRCMREYPRAYNSLMPKPPTISLNTW